MALAFGALFVVLVLSALAAPLWASAVAGRGPEASNVAGKIAVDGRQVDVVSLDGTPIGPQWRGEYFLGADANGRDVMVRLLYGARNSLLIGVAAALLTTILATLVGLLSGYLGRWVDAVARSTLDVIWAFPVILLGVALGTALAVGGLQVGPFTLEAGSTAISIAVIAVVYVPYMARPIRGEVLALREKEFVLAARAVGGGASWIILRHLLPNLVAPVIVVASFGLSTNIIVESSLSFLGLGVPVSVPTWGSMLNDGREALRIAWWPATMPGLAIMFTVLGVNALGDWLRDFLDPRLQGEH